ncbi:MAG: S41 family peptidase [Planctomycetota bacterium]|nr:S41 family peptidase [Planctomycetota bacterium]
MKPSGVFKRRFDIAIALLLLLLLQPGVASAQLQIKLPPAATGELETVLRKGREFESQQRWADALNLYEDFARKNPNQPALVERLDLAKVHYDLARRYSDSTFCRNIKSLSENDALELYSQVMSRLYTHYVQTPDWTALVNRGTLDLTVALYDSKFLSANAPDMPGERIASFRQQLEKLFAGRTVRDRDEARELVRQAAHLAHRELGISPTAVILEYVCGAAGGLDEYSTFLTSGQLTDLYSQIDGNFVGLGVELKARDNALLIVNVIPGSPAQKGGLKKNDRLIGVNGKTTRDLNTDQAADMLQGEAGTTVEVLAVTEGQSPRRIVIRRESIEVPSIENAHLVDRASGIAYLKLTCFQKTTSADLDTALWKLYREGMRSLIIDLRGNPGGLLTSSVEVADKFIESGGIVSTRGRSPQEDFNYTAHKAGTWRVPLVVLIDGDSASASEIFAGAMRDNRRATIVGQRSYGKGSVQGIFPLSVGGMGLRLTTAKFYSPDGHPFSGIGVEPEIVVHTTAKPSLADTSAAVSVDTHQLTEAGDGSRFGERSAASATPVSDRKDTNVDNSVAASDWNDATLAAGLQAARNQVASAR